jgi:hypothetical protein
MCLLAWIGATRPVATVPRPLVPGPDQDWRFVEAVDEQAPERQHFTLPLVYYVGSHEGCGCGYNSDDVARLGFDTLAEIEPLVDGLLTRERVRFEAEQQSRQFLYDLLVKALTESDLVEVFACWGGNEADPIVATEEVTPAHFVEQLRPIGEGVKYLVRSQRDVSGSVTDRD